MKTLNLFKGDRFTIKAVASEGYTFSHWTSADGSRINDASSTITASKNESYTAHFTKNAVAPPPEPEVTYEAPELFWSVDSVMNSFYIQNVRGTKMPANLDPRTTLHDEMTKITRGEYTYYLGDGAGNKLSDVTIDTNQIGAGDVNVFGEMSNPENIVPNSHDVYLWYGEKGNEHVSKFMSGITKRMW